jgi:hypothetical protein
MEFSITKDFYRIGKENFQCNISCPDKLCTYSPKKIRAFQTAFFFHDFLLFSFLPSRPFLSIFPFCPKMQISLLHLHFPANSSWSFSFPCPFLPNSSKFSLQLCFSSTMTFFSLTDKIRISKKEGNPKNRKRSCHMTYRPDQKYSLSPYFGHGLSAGRTSIYSYF